MKQTYNSKTQSQFLKSTLKLGFYTKPRIKLFVIPPLGFRICLKTKPKVLTVTQTNSHKKSFRSYQKNY